MDKVSIKDIDSVIKKCKKGLVILLYCKDISIYKKVKKVLKDRLPYHRGYYSYKGIIGCTTRLLKITNFDIIIEVIDDGTKITRRKIGSTYISRL